MTDSSFDEAIQKLRNWRRRSGVGLDFILPGLALGGLKEALNEEQLLENRISAIVSIHDFHSEHKLGDFFPTPPCQAFG
ncbi:hypothetical protein AAVH_00425 [Aphelenchoides avenae]|nr:hypothetical protein AAVH_00425 [Aphelenchus avenae]